MRVSYLAVLKTKTEQGKNEKKDKNYLTHQRKDIRQLGQRHRLDRHFDQAARKEINGLFPVAAVTHVTALDTNHLDDGVEHGRLEERVPRQADGHDGASRPHVGGGLLEGQLCDGDEEHGVRALTVWRDAFDVAGQVSGFGEIDEVLDAD